MFRSLAALFFTLALAATSTARTRESIHFAPIPPLKQCKPTTISWAGGTGPYLLSIASVESNKTDSYAPSLAFILQFGDLTTTTFVWNTGFPVGSALVFTIMDQTDKSLVNRTDTLTIQDGMSDACLPQVVGPIAYASNVTTSGLTLAPVPIVTPTSTASLWKATMSPSPTASASQASVRTTSGARGVAVAAGVMGSLFGIAVLLGVGCFLRRKRSVARSRRAIMSGMSFDGESEPMSSTSYSESQHAYSPQSTELFAPRVGRVGGGREICSVCGTPSTPLAAADVNVDARLGRHPRACEPHEPPGISCYVHRAIIKHARYRGSELSTRRRTCLRRGEVRRPGLTPAQSGPGHRHPPAIRMARRTLRGRRTTRYAF
ncbi:hypothetical protein C8Q77DRAFT_746379 [Trametes polyzona]|nr:hypothetical protein C8Q77DRAFT_746379 [Trametes polyzona]